MLNSIKTGNFLYDGGALFGVAPKLAWKEYYPADADNRCNLVMRSLLIQTGTRNILVDTGVGLKNADVMEEFGFFNMKDITVELEKCGCKPEDITDIVLTSLHFEHCGGTTAIGAGDKVELNFPNATVHVAESQWKTLLDPNERERYMMIPVDVMEVLKQDKLHVVKEDEQICPEVELKLVNGHTEGLLLVYIFDGDDTYVYTGDSIPTGVNVHLDWLDAHDIDPLKALATKKELLDIAIANKQWLIFPHDARFACARIAKNEDYYISEVSELTDCNQ